MMPIEKVNMRDYTSLRIGGVCDMVRVRSLDDLSEVTKFSKNNKTRIFILGHGTNSYFSENINDLLVIKIEIKGIKIIEENNESVIIKAYSGEIWDDVVRYTTEKGWWGIENLSWVPGTCGAGPVQNIGAYGTELSDTLVSVEAYNRESNQIEILNNKACELGYRDSVFKKHNPVGDSGESNKYIILSINIKLSKLYKPTLTYAPLNSLDQSIIYTPKEIRDIVIQTRKSKIPDYNILPNAGSFFKNPIINKDLKERVIAKYPQIPIYENGEGYKIPAAWLIEHISKMKGVRTGDVGTYQMQPLIIINYDRAESREILDFTSRIIDIIKHETGIVLEREVNYVE